MSILDQFRQLPTRTKQIAAVGAAGLGAVIVMRGRSRPDPIEEPATDGPAIPGGLPVTFSNGAIGVDQLMDFESSVVGELARLSDLLNRPQGPSTVPPAQTRAWLTTRTLAGESTNALAVRLRGTGAKTRDGRPLTTAYLQQVNGWNLRDLDRPHWTGTTVRY